MRSTLFLRSVARTTRQATRCVSSFQPHTTTAAGPREIRQRDTVRPRASNPRFNAKRPVPNVHNPKLLAEHLQSAGEYVPTSPWIRVDNSPPLSSLDAMLAGIRKALRQQEEERGILNLDAAWEPGDSSVPFLDALDEQDVIRKAHVLLSPFGRPTGWHLKLDNRSLVHALLTHDTDITCAWKPVKVREISAAETKINHHHLDVSDATVRVENCPPGTTLVQLINLFSRYDLRTSGGDSIQKWGVQKLETTNVPDMFLVHFADASWARAAVREQQSCHLRGRELRLSQYPRQIL